MIVWQHAQRERCGGGGPSFQGVLNWNEEKREAVSGERSDIEQWKREAEKDGDEKDGVMELLGKLEKTWAAYDGLEHLRIPQMISDAVELAVDNDAMHILDKGFGDLDADLNINYIMFQQDLHRIINNPSLHLRAFAHHDPFRVVHRATLQKHSVLLLTYHNPLYHHYHLQKDISFLRLVSFHPSSIPIIAALQNTPQLLYHSQEEATSLHDIVFKLPQAESVRNNIIKLGLRKRLAMCAQLCSAVQFMHRVGVTDLRIRNRTSTCSSLTYFIRACQYTL